MCDEVIVIAGKDVYAKIVDLQLKVVDRSLHTTNCLDSKLLCEFQKKLSDNKYLEAEIVKSFYGFGLRYASGLQNFGIIYSVRNKDLDGSFQDAVNKANHWVSLDPTKRYVTYKYITNKF